MFLSDISVEVIYWYCLLQKLLFYMPCTCTYIYICFMVYALRNTTQKSKDLATQRPSIKNRDERKCSGRVHSCRSANGTQRLTPVKNPMIKQKEERRTGY